MHLDPFLYLFDDYISYLRTVNTGDEGPDDIGVCNVGELSAFLGESANEVSKRLIRLLPIAPEVLGVPRAHVCTLKVPNKDPD